MDKIPITPKGYDALEIELKDLKYVQRPKVIEDISVAREHGDLKENAEYHAAREQQSFIEGRIDEVEAVISRANIIDPTKMTGNTVKFGATVEIVDEETDVETTYQIVGEQESDIDNCKLSIAAPLAKALIGKSVGDTVTVRTPKGATDYEILSVKWV